MKMIGKARSPKKVVPRIKGPPSGDRLAEIFGPVIKGRWANESLHMGYAFIPIPYRIVIGRAALYCNRHMSGSLEQALKLAYGSGMAREVKGYDGCYDPTSKLLGHRYGLTIALTPGAAGFSDEFKKCFQICGFQFSKNRFRWTSD